MCSTQALAYLCGGCFPGPVLRHIVAVGLPLDPCQCHLWGVKSVFLGLLEYLGGVCRLLGSQETVFLGLLSGHLSAWGLFILFLPVLLGEENTYLAGSISGLVIKSLGVSCWLEDQEMPARPSLPLLSFPFLWWFQVISLSQVYLGYMRVKKKTLGTCNFVIPQDLWSLASFPLSNLSESFYGCMSNYFQEEQGKVGSCYFVWVPEDNSIFEYMKTWGHYCLWANHDGKK